MAKRSGAGARGATTKNQVPAAPVGGTTEQRIVAFAEQIGRIAGTLSKKAEALVDRKTLNDQIASVRDGAAALLGHLASGSEKPKPSASKRGAKASAAPKPSRGPVDAPGKKHRKPPPPDPHAGAARSQAAKLRNATPMIKTTRRRGRG
jgi:hypothetical protein